MYSLQLFTSTINVTFVVVKLKFVYISLILDALPKMHLKRLSLQL